MSPKAPSPEAVIPITARSEPGDDNRLVRAGSNPPARSGPPCVREEVRGACEMVGLEPLYVANEGRLIAIVAPSAADTVLGAMRRHPLGRNAQLVGTVCASSAPLVTIRTALGTSRIADMLAGDQLPPIG